MTKFNYLMMVNYTRWAGLWLVFFIISMQHSQVVHGMQQTTQQLYFHKRIKSEPYTMMVKITLSECMEHCTLVSYCAAIAFDRDYQICRFYYQSAFGNNIENELVDFKGSVVVLKEDFISYDSTERLVLYAGKQVKRFIVLRPPAETECGAIQSVQGAAVFGNQITVGSRLKYVCYMNDDVTYVECRQDGTWSSLPICPVMNNGQPCIRDSDCGDPNALCIVKDGVDAVCFCKPEYKFIVSKQVCGDACTLSSEFSQMMVIPQFNTAAHVIDYNGAVTIFNFDCGNDCIDDCWYYCQRTFPQLFYSTITAGDHCWCKKITYSQVMESRPDITDTTNPGYVMTSRVCI